MKQKMTTFEAKLDLIIRQNNRIETSMDLIFEKMATQIQFSNTNVSEDLDGKFNQFTFPIQNFEDFITFENYLKTDKMFKRHMVSDILTRSVKYRYNLNKNILTFFRKENYRALVAPHTIKQQEILANIYFMTKCYSKCHGMEPKKRLRLWKMFS